MKFIRKDRFKIGTSSCPFAGKQKIYQYNFKSSIYREFLSQKMSREKNYSVRRKE